MVWAMPWSTHNAIGCWLHGIIHTKLQIKCDILAFTAHKQCPILFFSPLTSRGVWQYALITHRIGLSQIDLIKQIYYFLLRFLRFLRETPLPLAYGAENLRNPINLCEPITRICGFRDFCEKPPILSQMPQMAQKIFIIRLICVGQSSICAGRIAITP